MIHKIHKSENYTVISNVALRDTRLSLKAVGLLAKVMCLPPEWRFSSKGLIAICKEGKTSIDSALRELKKYGYLRITQSNSPDSGRFETVYDWYEVPCSENVLTENSLTEKPYTYKVPSELSNEIVNTDIIKHTYPSLEKRGVGGKKTYGQFNNVLLTDEELGKLKDRYSDWEQKIEDLSVYIESKGKKYKSHYATILVWASKKTETSKVENIWEGLE